METEEFPLMNLEVTLKLYVKPIKTQMIIVNKLKLKPAHGLKIN